LGGVVNPTSERKFTMVVVARTTSKTAGIRSASTPLNRFWCSRTSIGRPTSFMMERQPVILEWGSWMLRVGFTEQHQPKHLIPFSCPESSMMSEGEWYCVITPLLHLCWDRLMSSPCSRRVIILHPPLMPRNWNSAMSQSLWNLGVPAVVFMCFLQTPPLALAWKRGMVIHVGKTESCCVAHADGNMVENTLQISDSGYKAVVEDTEKICPSWSKDMDNAWTNEKNPNSLIQTIAKCLQTCPTDIRKDIASNLVFCGETTMIVPMLPNKIVDRLRALLQFDAPEMENITSELTAFPTHWEKLAPLHGSIKARSTGPYRPDMVSWIGASLWATVWHRHDEDNEHIPWIHAPNEDRTTRSSPEVF